MGTEAPAVNGSDRYDVLVVEKYEDEAGTEKFNWTRGAERSERALLLAAFRAPHPLSHILEPRVPAAKSAERLRFGCPLVAAR